MPTPDNLRAEMARHHVTRAAIGQRIAMHVNLLSMYLTGHRPLQSWAAHNIGCAINDLAGCYVFYCLRGCCRPSETTWNRHGGGAPCLVAVPHGRQAWHGAQGALR